MHTSTASGSPQSWASLCLLALLCSSAQAQQSTLSGGVTLDWAASPSKQHSQSDTAARSKVIGQREVVVGMRQTIEGLLPVVDARDAVTGAALWSGVYDLGSGKYGSVIAVDGSPDGQTVYVLLGSTSVGWQTSGLAPGEIRVLAINAADGNQRWNWKVSSPPQQAYNGVSLSVSANGDRIVVFGDSNPASVQFNPDLLVWALNPQGNVVWQKQIDSGFSDIARAGAVVGNIAYLAANNGPQGWSVRALDVAQGNPIWQRNYGGPGDFVEAFAASPSGNALAVRGSALRLLDAATGDLKWSAELVSTQPSKLAFDASGTQLFAAIVPQTPPPSNPPLRTNSYAVASGAMLWSTDAVVPGQPTIYIQIADLEVATQGQQAAVLAFRSGSSASAPVLALTLNTATGAPTWSQPIQIGEGFLPSGVDWNSSGSQALVTGTLIVNGNRDLHVRGLAAATGALQWFGGYDSNQAGSERGKEVVVDAAGKRVFALGSLETAFGTSSGVTITASDSATGALLWQSETLAPFSQSARLRLSPDGLRLYVARETAALVGSTYLFSTQLECRLAATGQLLWQSAPIQGRHADLQLQPNGSRIYAAITGQVNGGPTFGLTAAFDGLNGSPLWSQAYDPASSQEVPRGLVVSADGNRVFVHGDLRLSPVDSVVDAYFLGLNAQTGQQLWQSTYAAPDHPTQRTLSLAHSASTDRLHAVGQNGPQALSLAFDGTTGSLVFAAQQSFAANTQSQNNLIALLPDGQRLLVAGRRETTSPYSQTAYVNLQDATTGQVLWSKTLNALPFTAIRALDLADGGQTCLLTGSESASAFGPQVFLLNFPIEYAAGFTQALDVASGNELWSARVGTGSENVEFVDQAVEPTTGRVFVTGSLYRANNGRDQLLTSFELPSLIGNPSAVSLANGGSQYLNLRAGQDFAGATYLVLGSSSGTAPGIALANGTLPLNPDAYLTATLTSPNQAPLLGTLGSLNGLGQGFAEIRIPTGTAPSLAGLTLNHAAIGVRFTGPIPSLDWISNPLALTLTP